MKLMTIQSLSIPLSILLALSLAACGSDTTDSATSTSEQPSTEDVTEATTEDEETPVAADIVPEYVFTNTGSVEICELYLSPVDDESWGPDQLEEETIPVGEQFTLTNVPAGTYDAKAVGCDDAGEITLQLDITADEAEAAQAPAESAEVVPEYIFTNTGSVEICELYLSPVDDESWGPDQLEEETIPVGEQFTLTNIPVGTYDAQAVGCDDAGEVTLQLDITN